VELEVRQESDAVTVGVHVKPRASKSRVLGARAGALDVAVAAPPVDGEANLELVRTLARHLGIAAARVSIVGGASGRNKRVRIAGIGADELRLALHPREV
jgi:uncharacterized protein